MTSPTNCPCDEPKDTEAEIARALNAIAAGQTALARQVRSFPAVREALLDALPDATVFDENGLEIRPLVDWRARNSRDLGLMLLEMWAYVSDVLSFYDERIANESYIRTAQRAVSLRRLVELLGYIPAPGIAGSVTLAALAEGRKAVSLPVGTAFRSDAFGDQPPQVFEITAPTNIHPFKNEWTVGPIPQTILPQPTPTQVEEQASGITPTGGEYLVFETLEFGLAVDRFALITVGGLPTATQVMAIKSFAGRDGRTYAEVRFNPHVRFPGPGPGADVKVPTVTAVVTRFTRTIESGETEPRPPVEPGAVSGEFVVYLDSVYRQLRPSDAIIVTGFETPQAGTVVRAQEQPVVVQSAEDSASEKDVTIPVTRLEISGVVLPTSADERNKLTFHFSMVNGGRVTAVGETELTPQQLTNSLLPVTGNVERPPGVNTTAPLTQQFLLTDPDGNAAEIAGRMFFGSSGRAQLAIDENPSASPPPLPAALYKTPLSVFGNVITATRGETVHNEVLGSGDPRIAGQSFTLKKKPLTYVDAPNELGRESSLQLFVDSVRWREVLLPPLARARALRALRARGLLQASVLALRAPGGRGGDWPRGLGASREACGLADSKARCEESALRAARAVIVTLGLRGPSSLAHAIACSGLEGAIGTTTPNRVRAKFDRGVTGAREVSIPSIEVCAAIGCRPTSVGDRSAALLSTLLSDARAVVLTCLEAIGLADAFTEAVQTSAALTTDVIASVPQLVPADLSACAAVSGVGLRVRGTHSGGPASRTCARRAPLATAVTCGSRRAATSVPARSRGGSAAGAACPAGWFACGAAGPRCHATGYAARSSIFVATCPAGCCTGASGFASSGAALRLTARRGAGSSAMRSAGAGRVAHAHFGEASETHVTRAVVARTTLRSGLALGRVVVPGTIVAGAAHGRHCSGSVDQPPEASSIQSRSHCVKRSHARSACARRRTALVSSDFIGVLS